MRHFIVASHGRFAEGILDSVRLITGELENVRCYGAYLDPEENVEQTVADMLAEYPLEDEVVVVTDIMGGSVCNQFIRHMGRANFHLIAGMNLALLLEMFTNSELPVEELISTSVGCGRSAVAYCNPIVEELMQGEL